MDVELDVKVENKLILEKRGLSVYNHFTGGAHIISHGSSFDLPLRSVDENDYLHIAAFSGPGDLKNDCLINLPSWLDFEFSLEGKVSMSHWDDTISLKIPAGPPTWQLKVTRTGSGAFHRGQVHITVMDGARAS